MNTRRYNNFLYTIGYLLILRVVLMITVDISIFSLGILFDTIFLMFWVGAIGLLMKKKRAQKTYYIIVIIIATIFVVGDSLYYDYFETISARSSFGGLRWLNQVPADEYNIQIPLVAYLITPLLIGTLYLIITNKLKDVFVIKDFGILSILYVIQIIVFLVW